jgi:hypothetical protein
LFNLEEVEVEDTKGFHQLLHDQSEKREHLKSWMDSTHTSLTYSLSEGGDMGKRSITAELAVEFKGNFKPGLGCPAGIGSIPAASAHPKCN